MPWPLRICHFHPYVCALRENACIFLQGLVRNYETIRRPALIYKMEEALFNSDSTVTGAQIVKELQEEFGE